MARDEDPRAATESPGATEDRLVAQRPTWTNPPGFTRYEKAVRLAEPHDYGVIEGTPRLLVFQLQGPDSGEGAVGWRLLDVVKLESFVATCRTFAGSRGQSHQQHYQWETLYARVT